MPQPHKGETERAFLARCMGDAEALDSFPRSDQRAAFCHAQWRRHDNCSCGHHWTANAARRLDPTRTTWLRSQYEAAMQRRFKALRRLIVEAVADNDALGLRTNAAPGPGAFNFPRSDAKVSAFMRWLQRAADQGILEIQLGTPIASAARQSWQGVYLQSAYQAGIQQAASNIRGQGATVEPSWVQTALLRPVHADRAGLIYTRAYNDLKGITDAMSATISRTLAQGIIEGRAPKQMAKMLTDRVDIAAKRARVLARTEVIRAHAEATLNSYTEAGLEDVTIDSEFTTSRDNKVCPRCKELEGTVYTIEQARGVIPVHPQCRCAWLPVVKDPSGVVLK